MPRGDQNQECALALPVCAVWNVLKIASMCFRSWGPVPRADWGGPTKANLIRVRFLQRAGAWPLFSVDAGPTREGTPADAPGGPPPTEARGFGASTTGSWAAWRHAATDNHPS